MISAFLAMPIALSDRSLLALGAPAGGTLTCFAPSTGMSLGPQRGRLLALGEGESERIEQRSSGRVVDRRRDDRDVHASCGVDAVVVDLREDQLLGDAERVVASAVPRG